MILLIISAIMDAMVTVTWSREAVAASVMMGLRFVIRVTNALKHI